MLTARMTASPISCMGTSVEDGWRGARRELSAGARLGGDFERATRYRNANPASSLPRPTRSLTHPIRPCQSSLGTRRPRLVVSD